MSWTHAPPTPFGEPWDRLQLDRPPLARVVAQVRFAPVLRVSDQDFIAPFQEEIRKHYPILSRDLQQPIIVTDEGARTGEPTTVWRFRNPNEPWELSLAPNFLSLDTQEYTDRYDFFRRLEEGLMAAQEHIRPALTERVGVRYVDRIKGHDLRTRITNLIRTEMLNVGNADLGSASMMFNMTEARFEVDRMQLKARWGYLPEGASHDPSIEAAEEPSWILDVDASSLESDTFDAENIITEARRFGDITYRFFRWTVSDAFLKQHGGEL